MQPRMVSLMTALMVIGLVVLCAPIFVLRDAANQCEKAGGRVMQTDAGLTCAYPSRRGKLT